MDPITICGLLGLLATSYAIYVEKMTKYSKQYAAVCDISDRISCTRVLKSPYSRLTGLTFNLPKESIFNVPNTYYGILFYLAVCIYPLYPFTLIPLREILLLCAASFSVILSFILAGILYFKLKNCCVICVVTYFINMAIFFNSISEIKTRFFY